MPQQDTCDYKITFSNFNTVSEDCAAAFEPFMIKKKKFRHHLYFLTDHDKYINGIGATNPNDDRRDGMSQISFTDLCKKFNSSARLALFYTEYNLMFRDYCLSIDIESAANQLKQADTYIHTALFESSMFSSEKRLTYMDFQNMSAMERVEATVAAINPQDTNGITALIKFMIAKPSIYEMIMVDDMINKAYKI